jgi:hypothetical protein
LVVIDNFSTVYIKEKKTLHRVKPKRLQSLLDEVGFKGETARQATIEFIDKHLSEVMKNRLPEFYFRKKKPFKLMFTLRTILSFYRLTGDQKYIKWFHLSTSTVVENLANRCGKRDYKNEMPDTWLWEPHYSSSRFNNKKMTNVFWTACVALPLTEFTLLIKKNPELKQDYGELADNFCDVAETAIKVHDQEWRDGPKTGEGHYIFPKASPMRWDGVSMPHNTQSVAGQVLLNLFRLTGNQKYLYKAAAIAYLLFNRIVYADDGSVWWPYWYGEVYHGYVEEDQLSINTPSQAPRQNAEDAAHASLTSEFIYKAYSNGIIFYRQDIEKLQNTLSKLVIEKTTGMIVIPLWGIDGTKRSGISEENFGGGWVWVAGRNTEILQQLFKHHLRMVLKKIHTINDMTGVLFSGQIGITLAYLLEAADRNKISLKIPDWEILQFSVEPKIIKNDKKQKFLLYEIPCRTGRIYNFNFMKSMTKTGWHGCIRYLVKNPENQIILEEREASATFRHMERFSIIPKRLYDQCDNYVLQIEASNIIAEPMHVLSIKENS